MKAKKFPPGGGTPSGAYQGVDIESPYQQGHSTTSATELQEVILGLLHTGQGNAVSLRDLCNVTGWSGRRVRLIIHKARRDGIPILSDNENGYFLPGDLSEVRHFCASMFRRGREIEDTARAVRKAVGV